MIAAEDQMTKEQIKDYLRNERPWLATDAATHALLDFGCTINNIANQITRIEESVEHHTQDYRNADRERLSIYPEAQDGHAFRLAFYKSKKAADEAVELATLRKQFFDPKYGSKIIVNGGRRPLDSLTLAELRAAKADVENHKRMKGMSASELLAENAAKRPKDTRRHPPYDNLPDEVTAAELNKFLRGPEARKLLRRHGAENLNDRLYGRG